MKTVAFNGKPTPHIRKWIAQVLAEDVGSGDVTTLALVDTQTSVCANLVARHDVVACGMELAAEVFRQTDSKLKISICVPDGTPAKTGATLLTVTGAASSILTAERTALNVAQRMTGIATGTAAVVRKIAPSGTQILDTRKTTPGLRQLEKYAVKCGGGTNHRFGLYDAILIKDNHLAFWNQKHKGTLATAIQTARKAFPRLKIEIEVDTLAQLKDALLGKPDWVLLDNMTPAMVKKAVALCRGICKTEASGGITTDTVGTYARTGVTAISMGALTHSAKAADLTLDFVM